MLFDTGTIFALSYLFGMLLLVILLCSILSKITRGTFCCKRQISSVSYQENNV
jgi:hypothetical protein